MTRDSAPRPRRWLLWASGLMLIAAGCADPPAMPQVPAAAPPVLAGQARIWFYRDVPAGHYHIAPVSYNRDFNQDRDVDLVFGQQLYVKILSSQSWDGACRDCVRDTFYAWLIPAQVAQGEIARAGGGI